MLGNGILKIQSYGASDENDIKFLDARLVSLELPEQNDESAGVQNLEYSFVFEAYNLSSLGSPSEFCISSAEENWDLSVNEDQMAITDLGDTPYRTYTLTHTLSATGYKKLMDTAPYGLEEDGEAWRQAVKWIEQRLRATVAGNKPSENILSDIMNNSNATKSEFSPWEMDKYGEASLHYDLYDEFDAYNHIRQVQSDIGAGSYSVTDTWLISNKEVNATHDLEVSIESSEEQISTVVTVQGTVQGADTNSSTDDTSAKYTNAKTALTTVLANTYLIANGAYSDSGFSGTLRNTVLSESLGHNKTAGAITFTRVYDDTSVDVADALRQNVTVTYDNVDGTNNVVAILGVLSRAAGPIIQDMNTTRERKVSVSIDLTMLKTARTSKPSTVYTNIAAPYKPTNGKEETRTESWSPTTGQYNLSVGWVFAEDYVAGG